MEKEQQKKVSSKEDVQNNKVDLSKIIDINSERYKRRRFGILITT